MNEQEDYRSQLLRKRFEKRAAWTGQPTQAQRESALQSVALLSFLMKHLCPAAYSDAKRQQQRPVMTHIPSIHGTPEELEGYRYIIALLLAFDRALSRLPFLRSRSNR